MSALGVSRALCVTPAAAGALMACVALRPLPSTVFAAEIARKVLTYSLARPTREVLFTGEREGGGVLVVGAQGSGGKGGGARHPANARSHPPTHTRSTDPPVHAFTQPTLQW